MTLCVELRIMGFVCLKGPQLPNFPFSSASSVDLKMLLPLLLCFPFTKTKFFEFQLLFHFWTSMSFYFLQLYFNFFNNIESRAYITRGESIFFFDIFIEIFVKLSSRRTLFSFVGYVLQVFEKKKKKLAILEGWFWNMANRLKILKNGCFRCA